MECRIQLYMKVRAKPFEFQNSEFVDDIIIITYMNNVPTETATMRP
jgi:hypothetical protein